MESAERLAVRHALNELKPYLEAFISQHRARRVVGKPDIAALLKALLDGWDDVFKSHLPRVARSYVHELLDVRNRWAHEEPFSTEEARRAVDTARQLGLALGAPIGRKQAAMASERASPASERQRSGQRATMREIYERWRNDEDRVIREYAEAERSGRVVRKANKSGLTPEEYAKALLADGRKKGWLE